MSPHAANSPGPGASGLGPVVEIEITEPLDLTNQQLGLVDMHTFLNILNVLLGEMYLITMSVEDELILTRSLALAEELRRQLDARRFDQELADQLDATERVFKSEMEQVLEARPALGTDPDIEFSVKNIDSVFKVLRVRTAEHLERLRAPDAWVPHDIRALTDKFLNFLAAVERNSKGRYHIVFNIAEQEPQDYLVNLRIESKDGPMIVMPSVLQDVLRDLIANARKYTAPGGMIVAGLADNGAEIRLVVEDNGRGIPPDELGKVVAFGYRASNAKDVKTKGGGFGLTKACLTARQFGGRMWLRSGLGLGTRVTIAIPRPITHNS